MNIPKRPGRTALTLFLILAGLSAAAFAQQQTGFKGKVRKSNGTGIAKATVTAVRDKQDIKSAVSASDGTFQITGLTPGTYVLRVEADGYATGTTFPVDVKQNKVRDLGDRLFLNVDQGTQVILRGSVFFKEGTSVTGAKVELERVNADGSVKRLGSTETSVTGEFTFRQPDGAAKYRVRAGYKGAAAVKEIEVSNAAVYQIALSLEMSRDDR